MWSAFASIPPYSVASPKVNPANQQTYNGIQIINNSATTYIKGVHSSVF
jgi:hypothetical protein